VVGISCSSVSVAALEKGEDEVEWWLLVFDHGLHDFRFRGNSSNK
jgi:hypothetical protein